MKNRQISIPCYGGLHRIDTTICYKGDQIVNKYSYVISVKADKKYGYFVITQKIYHHEIMFTIRFADCDKIVYTDPKGDRKEITQND